MLSRREEKQKLKSVQLKVWQNPFGLHVGFNWVCVSVQVCALYSGFYASECLCIIWHEVAIVVHAMCVFVSRQCTTAQKKWHFIPQPPRQKKKKGSLLPWKWQVTPWWKVCWCCETASRGERGVKRKEQGSLKMGLIDWTHTHIGTRLITHMLVTSFIHIH